MQDHVQAILTGKDIEKFETVMQHYSDKAGVDLTRSQIIKTLINEKWAALKLEELTQ